MYRGRTVAASADGAAPGGSATGMGEVAADDAEVTVRYRLQRFPGRVPVLSRGGKMSGSWIAWMLISWLTGNPILALLVVAAAWWLGDRATFRVLPDPLRLLGRRSRVASLRRTLSTNPHDRRARLELGTLLLEGRRPAEAAKLLRQNAEAGDDDLHTTFALGAALARIGDREGAERYLAAARARDPAFRLGEIDLELGRLRVRAGDAAGALEPLRRLVAARPGTVEGRYWLAQALERQGDAAGAARARDEAWGEYAALPRFRRSHERPYAWRIRPWRPALVAAALLIAAALLLRAVVPELSAMAPPAAGPVEQDDR
jgi:tetratricopeptide (TPR) repeat protein